jgi:hypothetical protein
MSKGNAPAPPLDPETRRALQLDALAAILPMDRRDRLAELPTDEDVENPKASPARRHGREQSAGALASDLGYLDAWAGAVARQPLPAAEALALKFVAHHLWDPAKRASHPKHGMAADVAESLRAEGLLRSKRPHAPKHRQAAPGELEFIAPLKRDRGTVRRAESALRPAVGRSGLVTAARAQGQSGGSPAMSWIA